MAKSMDLIAHVANFNPAGISGQMSFEERDEDAASIAVVSISGTMTKHGSSIDGGASTIAIRKAIRSAARDSTIDGIMINIDSPGGTVAGTQELADEITKAKAAKPVFSFIEDAAASAAFWVASQSTKIFANESALVGSIGVFAVLTDSSGMAKQDGVEVHVVRAGEFKGMGTPGTEITEAHIEESQRIVNQINDQFLQSVSDGRGMAFNKVKELADGRVHIAKDSVKLNLIDKVGTFETAMAELAKATTTRRQSTMAEDTTATLDAVAETNQAATFQELKAAFPEASADFICEQMEKKATVSEASSALMAAQNAELNARAEELKAKEAEIDKLRAASASRSGVDELKDEKVLDNSAEAIGGDPISQFNALVKDNIKAGMTKKQAIRSVAVNNRELHEAYKDANAIVKKR
jgi:signal peptide peptidase SppA